MCVFVKAADRHRIFPRYKKMKKINISFQTSIVEYQYDFDFPCDTLPLEKINAVLVSCS